MVPHSRKAARPGAVRALNLPRPVGVKAKSNGVPVEVRLGKAWRKVIKVQDRWRIEDEWWREKPVARLYWQVLLDGGQKATLFQDLSTGQWHEQRYG